MIRHITSLENYKKIKEEGIIRCSVGGADPGLVSFEVFEDNDSFVEYIRNGKQEFQDTKLVGLLIDEDELKEDGFCVIYTDSSTEESRRESIYTTRYENITRTFSQETEEYNQIGEYVHVKGNIPGRYIKKVLYYD